MTDWSEPLINAERFMRKGKDYLVAAQSLSPTAKQVALVNAECKLLEAIGSLRDALAVVRGRR
jgi:hypothetical protein